MDAHLAEQRREQRFLAVALAGFAALGLVVALAGVFGLVQTHVAERQRELAIRIAMGATPPGIAAAVLRRLVVLIAASTAAGLWLGLVGARALQSFLVGLTPTHPATLAAVTLLTWVVVAIAAWVPTRRATRIEPVVLLKTT